VRISSTSCTQRASLCKSAERQNPCRLPKLRGGVSSQRSSEALRPSAEVVNALLSS
jgi:hypothetical protein